MSQEKVEIVRRAIEAYNRRDPDGFLEEWAPNAVVDWSQSRGIDAHVFRGHDEIRAFMLRFLDAFESVRIELVDDPVEVDDGLLIAENVAYMKGRDGIEVQARSAFLIRIRGGQQTSLTLYQSRGEALEAARLSEQSGH
jgi:ketosteroid isomerase-like protein